MPGKDFHLPNHVRFQAHERGLPSPPEERGPRTGAEPVGVLRAGLEARAPRPESPSPLASHWIAMVTLGPAIQAALT